MGRLSRVSAFGRRCSLAIALAAILSEGWTASLFGADWPSPNSVTTKNILTNQGVVMLARAGYSEGFIIDIIYQKQTQFDVSVEGLAWLAKQGLSERVIRTMVTNERKEEKTAIVPATVQIVTEDAQGAPQSRRMEVQVPLPVVFPAPGSTPGPSQSSWYVSGFEKDKWYIVPNVPVFTPANSRR